MIGADGYARVALPETPRHAARSHGRLRTWRSEEREAMGTMLETWPWRVYATWTFSTRIGEDGALREIQAWLALLRFAFGRDVGWMVGIEQEHNADWPHAHGLICGDRVVAPTTMYAGKRHERTVPLIEPYWRAWMDRHGRGDFQVISGTTRGCSFYCAKYAAKRGQIVFSANLEKFRGRGAALAPLSLYPRQEELAHG